MNIRPPERAATLFARPKPRDGTLLRLAAWGTCAALSLATLVVVAQSPAGGKRLALTMAGLDEPAQAVSVPGPPQSDALVKSLEARIASLTSDRNRLAARVAALESGFEDLTGSVRRQAAATTMPTAVPPAPAPVQAVEAKTPALMVVAVAPPLINPLATPPAGIASVLPEPPAPKTPPAPEPPKIAAPDATAPGPAAAETAAPEAIPLPPERVAEAEPAQDAKPAAGTARVHSEFGVELATESSLDGLRKRWVSVKANYGPLLLGLSPVAVRDQHPGSRAVRLVAGPLPNLTAARKLCARFASMNADCWPARINPADVIQR